MKLRRVAAVGGAAIVASLSVGISPAHAAPYDDDPTVSIQPEAPPCALTQSDIECPGDGSADEQETPADDTSDGPSANEPVSKEPPTGAFGTYGPYGPYDGFGSIGPFGPFGPPAPSAPSAPTAPTGI